MTKEELAGELLKEMSFKCISLRDSVKFLAQYLVDGAEFKASDDINEFAQMMLKAMSAKG